MATKSGTPNRLINETSTYLLQHAHNPVDWYPWGEEALGKARKEDKPILLSIGYAACHWCHVMEHESFEDKATAELMNENFVNIKVDREERTDLDEIYMKAVQMMTGHGGWPMTVFLTPDLKPFFGGTYFPPQDRHGLPGFKRVLQGVSLAWKEEREQLLEGSKEITDYLINIDKQQKRPTDVPVAEFINQETLDDATDHLLGIFDHHWGGFGGAPKFPHTFCLQLAMHMASPASQTKPSRRVECKELVTTTLDRMAMGGINDQLSGGFARYSVDRQWLVPHFEKMLYDNALLAQTYLEGYLLTGRKYWADVAGSTLDFVLNELATPEGAFYSSLDADSEGEEGKFYVFARDKIFALLGAEDGKWFCDVLGVSQLGNFEHGTSVLHFSKTPEETAKQHDMSVEELWKKLQPLKEKVLVERSTRVRPGRDEKVLTSWNSLMITALVEGYRALKEERYLKAAIKAASFLLDNLVKDGRPLRTYGSGKARLKGYLDDYAYLAQALLDLASVDPNPRWIETTNTLVHEMLERFWDKDAGGFFYTADDHEELLTRPKTHVDGSIPSGTSVAAMVLLKLNKLYDKANYLEKVEEIFKVYAALLLRAPDQFANLLCVADYYIAKGTEIAIVSDTSSDELKKIVLAVNGTYLPNKLAIVADKSTMKQLKDTPLFINRSPLNGKPTAFICHNYTCDQPMTDAAKVEEKVKGLVS